MEAIRKVQKVNVQFPKVANYRYTVSVSINGMQWETLFDEGQNQLAYKYKSFESQEGKSARFLRISFTESASSNTSGLGEIQVFGN